ncbi:MAG: DNA polymerase III subunit chi [Halofilum sp. (in: g-proteobacteria)]|nr:DNA polymerase III subunit chi [Halofilum sp. (in: g-proteobacteria)]
MARVDFYILSDVDEASRQSYLCRVADKAARKGLRVWIHATESAAALDERLWSFSQGSFVPHELAADGFDPECPVLIGDGEPADECQVLINDNDEIPPFAARFERIAEVVGGEPGGRRRARERFRQYRDQGHEMHHHEVD